jgi:hypothetical protein
VKRIATAVGVGTVAAGLYVVLVGATGSLDLNYTFVTLVGALAVVQGLRYGLERRATPVGRSTTADPELRAHVPVPGDGHDTDIANASGWSYRAKNRRQTVREHLRAVAVETIAARENVTDAAARERVDDGSWTEDPLAAAFLGASTSRPPLREQLRARLRRESSFSYRARRTVAAIAELQASDADVAATTGSETR